MNSYVFGFRLNDEFVEDQTDPYTPEKRLLLAILEMATRDLLSSNLKLQRNAISWFTSKAKLGSRHYLYFKTGWRFKEIIDILGLADRDVNTLLAKVSHATEQYKARQETEKLKEEREPRRKRVGELSERKRRVLGPTYPAILWCK